MPKNELTGQLTNNQKTIMNSNDSDSARVEPLTYTDLALNSFSAFCREKLAALKNALVQRFSAEYSDLQPHLVRRAVHDADALASLTAIPHLLLPVLAEEKVQKARSWSLHQQRAFQRSRLAHAA